MLCAFSTCLILALSTGLRALISTDRIMLSLCRSASIDISEILKIYFEAEPVFENRYTIKSTKPLLRFRPTLPITRDLLITIDPPMPRLLAIHRACCLIMHLSGAGEYIDKVFRDIEEIGVKSDGTTELGSIISLRLYQRGEQARVF
jgi:hypothetical protein